MRRALPGTKLEVLNMFESLHGVDWNLLHRQKLTLLALRQRQPEGSVEADALSGVIHLLDALQDDATACGRWSFPGEPDESTGHGPRVLKRYYVEDDEGHHHGPMDDYDEAASVADAIHGRIISQEAEQSEWSVAVPRILYEAYPDQDLLPIEPPHAGESIGAFSRRAERAGDTLFLFLCREANEEIDCGEYVTRLDRAILDITCVQNAFRGNQCLP
jgi:hypothetical protein